MNAYFNNKVIWITGASSGIGEALVRELAIISSAKIILSSRREEQLYAIAQKAGLDKDRYAVITVDLERYTDMPVAATKAIDKFGRIDILINNAGLSQRSLAMETSIEVDKRLMDVDFIGTVALTKAVVPYMIKNKGGQIVVVSSLMGLLAHLCAVVMRRQNMLCMVFEALRAELYNDNILVTMICPGFIQTNISVNAVTGTGASQDTMDDASANGMPVNIFAQKMLKAIAKQKYQAVIGGKEKLGVYIKRFFPSLLARVVRKAKVV